MTQVVAFKLNEAEHSLYTILTFLSTDLRDGLIALFIPWL
jgi:hypothetical protein